MERKNWVRVSLTKKGNRAWERQVGEKTARSATACLSEKELGQLGRNLQETACQGSELVRQMQTNPYGDLLF